MAIAVDGQEQEEMHRVVQARALQQKPPAHVRLGSLATETIGAGGRSISAVPPKADHRYAAYCGPRAGIASHDPTCRLGAGHTFRHTHTHSGTIEVEVHDQICG